MYIMFYEVLLDALLDTAYLIPILLLMHLLIEFFEVRSFSKLTKSRVLKGGLAPLIGTGVGLLPQCGFSVVASKMYSKKYITLGTLAAVFIATSDEAIPIMLGSAFTDSSVWLPLLQLIGIKVIIALAVGYALNFFFRKKEVKAETPARSDTYGCCGHAVVGQPKECELPAPDEDDHDDHDHAGHDHSHSDAKGESKAKHIWHSYFKHPIVHTLVISLYILVINLLLGTILFFVGEDKLVAFMEAGTWLQPLFAAIVGLIPNCASSVLITEMFLSGTLTLGAAVSGLAINAGLGFMVLFKENKNIKENIMILVGLFVLSVAVGYMITAIVRI